MASGRNREVIDLNQKQLLKLAEVIHLQEIEKIYDLKLDYDQDIEYRNKCKLSWETTKKVLTDIQTMKDKAKAENDAAKISIAHDLFEYSRQAVSMSLQTIRSYNSRLTFMEKLSSHSTYLTNLLDTLDPKAQIDEVEHLAKKAAVYREFVMDYERKLNDFVPNEFTKWIQKEKTTVHDLVVKHMKKLDYKGAFEDLQDVQKLHVYESVIESAGRGKSVVSKAYHALGPMGSAVLVFAAATMVWDIATAENKLEAATKDAVSLLVGEIAVAEIATTVITMGFEAVGIEVATATIAVMGSIVGLGVGVLIGVAAGALIEVIFNSGGKLVQSSDGLTRCVVAPMPDGLELARNIKRFFPDG